MDLAQRKQISGNEKHKKLFTATDAAWGSEAPKKFNPEQVQVGARMSSAQAVSDYLSAGYMGGEAKGGTTTQIILSGLGT